jgi:hypothetical protein
MADCNSDALLGNIDADCDAVKRMGGVKSVLYAVRLANIESVTIDNATKNITGVTLKAGAKFLRLEGRKFRNTAGTELGVSDNGPRLRNQTVSARFFVKTQLQRDLVNALWDQEDMVLFVPTNGGVVKVYGYSLPPNESSGLSVSGGGESDGTAMADDTSLLTTFTGSEYNLPPIFEVAAGYADTIEYLDDLVSA